eukprot:1897512-Rhodomonas_salina.5
MRYGVRHTEVCNGQDIRGSMLQTAHALDYATGKTYTGVRNRHDMHAIDTACAGVRNRRAIHWRTHLTTGHRLKHAPDKRTCRQQRAYTANSNTRNRTPGTICTENVVSRI